MEDGARDEKRMPFLDHLEEMRWRILKALAAVVLLAVGCLYFGEVLLNLLTSRLQRLDNPPKLVFLSPAGMLLVRMNVALVAGAILALPVIFYQAWAFIAPGLVEKERSYVLRIVGFSMLCFLAGGALAYEVVVPISLRFMVKMTAPGIDPFFDIRSYIGFVVRFIIAFGLVFEMPVISYFLTKIGLMTPRFLSKNRRYAIVLIFVVAAVLTPPDVLSQILMAIPLIALYEISIWVSKLAGRREVNQRDGFTPNAVPPRAPSTRGPH
jgi:sec-independent protein translocase protein TatC